MYGIYWGALYTVACVIIIMILTLLGKGRIIIWLMGHANWGGHSFFPDIVRGSWFWFRLLCKENVKVCSNFVQNMTNLLIILIDNINFGEQFQSMILFRLVYAYTFHH